MALTCFPAKDVTFSHTTGTGILNISWTGNVSGDYRVAIYNLITGTSSEVLVSGLNHTVAVTAGNAYSVSVKTMCDGYDTVPAWASIVIPAAGTGASNLVFEEYKSNSVVVAWQGPNGRYVVHYGNERDGFDSVVVDDNSNKLRIGDLDPDSNYQFYVHRYINAYQVPCNEYLDKMAGCCLQVPGTGCPEVENITIE